jgi:osmotically-inducible protein OsmY
MVLITGEVPSEADRDNLARAIGGMDNVREVFNELTVAGATSMTSRANDVSITGRVKAKLVEANDIPATSVKVVTERGVVYLMGLLTATEQAKAVERTRTVGGVTKVVSVFETLTEAELAKMGKRR